MGLYAGVFLVTASGLVLEIALTRIFSATIWYHFAFVAISVALLGWGLGGFALHAWKARLPPSAERAGLFTLLYGASIPLCLWLLVRLPFVPDRLAFYFAASLVPALLRPGGPQITHQRRAAAWGLIKWILPLRAQFVGA